MYKIDINRRSIFIFTNSFLCGCCKLLLSRGTQTPPDIAREIEQSGRRAERGLTKMSSTTQSEEKAR